MGAVLLENANVLDVVTGRLLGERHVLVADGRIKEISEVPLRAADAQRIDLHGRVLMPGLCDAHIHAISASNSFAELERWSPFYTATRMADILRNMLLRGFTTVRDAGGADWGIAAAIEEGYIDGPRLLFCGKAL